MKGDLADDEMDSCDEDGGASKGSKLSKIAKAIRMEKLSICPTSNRGTTKRHT